MAGKHALVCGASQGIGLAAANQLALLDADVTLLARDATRLQQAAAQLPGKGQKHWLAADLDERDGAEASISKHVANHPVHIVINNTGGPPAGALLDATDQDFLVPYGRHLLMAQRILRLTLPAMRDAGYGRIVNVLSTSVREPIPNLGVSNTIRATMAAWAKTLSRELPPGVTINNVLPGFTDTPRLASLAEANAARQGSTADDVRATWLASIPEGRLGHPDELGATIAWLCTPAAAYIRGQSLAVDGGRLNGI